MEVGKEFILGLLSGNFQTTTEKKHWSLVIAEAVPYNATLYSIQKGTKRQLLWATAWMALTDTVLNKRSQTQKSTYCMKPVIQSSAAGKLMYDG